MSSEIKAAAAFDLGGNVINVRPLGHGLINDTFLVTTDAPDRPHTVLQRINRRAFQQPEHLMQNLRTLSSAVRSDNTQDAAMLRLPDIVATRDGRDFCRDEHGDFWRALTYIEDTVTRDAVANIAQAEQVGAALGHFHVLAGCLDPTQMRVTRPGFHQTPGYYARYTEATLRPNPRTAEPKLNECMAFAEARSAIVTVLEETRQSGALPLRVIHGDPKIDNFLFDLPSERIVGIIDLDTVQPGLVHYDIGDCVRSCANPAGESPADETDARFDLDICQAILKRYLDETRGFLTAPEIAQVYDAVRLIPFELGLRFLTDHLEGDIYFKTDWRGHNLHRARVQFRLAADIEKHERRIRGMIAELAR